jgi:predicted Zn-dependent protease
MTPVTRRHLLGGLCSCSALTLAACNATNAPEGRVVAGARPLLSSEEAGLWQAMDKAEAEVRESRFRIRDRELDRYVNDVVCRLVADHCPDVRVYVMRTPYFNAQAAPNGMIQVWSGLLLRTQNEAQLAAVLGHELGHYLERHSLQRMREVRDSRSVAAWLTVGFGGAGAVAGLAVMASAFGFSRDQERVADRIGLELMTKAGYAPLEFPRLWEDLIAEEKADPNRKNRDIFFETHPSSEDRAATLRQQIQVIGDAGDTFEARFRAQLRGIRLTLLEDELKLRQYGRTLVLLRQIEERSAEDGELAYGKGEVYRLRDEDGDRTRAIEAYGRAVALGNYPPELHRSLGLLQVKTGDRKLAQASFRKYLELRPQASDRTMIESYIGGQG